MKIGMIQILVKDDWNENLAQAREYITKAADAGADIVVLPELWNTPFDNESIVRHADEWDKLILPLKDLAKEKNIWILSGTIPYRDQDINNNKLYNRAALINPAGEIVKTCDKNHLLEVHARRHSYLESDVFAPGQELCKAETPWGQAGICICYDIRFPESARLLSQDSQLLFVPAGFNATVGAKHWKPLLQTRAMENEIFVIGVNPQKADYNNYTSYGHSMIVNPDGVVVYEMKENEPWAVAEIDLNEVGRIRTRSPFWKLRREDLYKLEESRREEN